MDGICLGREMALWVSGVMKRIVYSFSIAFRIKIKRPPAQRMVVVLTWMVVSPILSFNIACLMEMKAAALEFFNMPEQVTGIIIPSGIASVKMTAVYRLRMRVYLS